MEVLLTCATPVVVVNVRLYFGQKSCRWNFWQEQLTDKATANNSIGRGPSALPLRSLRSDIRPDGHRRGMELRGGTLELHSGTTNGANFWQFPTVELHGATQNSAARTTSAQHGTHTHTHRYYDYYYDEHYHYYNHYYYYYYDYYDDYYDDYYCYYALTQAAAGGRARLGRRVAVAGVHSSEGY